MKNFSTLLLFFTLLFAGNTYAQDDCISGQLSLVVVSEAPGELVFDLFVNACPNNTCGPIYLGAVDVNIDYDPTAFTGEPVLSKVGSSTQYTNLAPFDTSDPINAIVTSAGYHNVASLSTNAANEQMRININSATPGGQSALETSIAYIPDDTPNRLGRFSANNYTGSGHSLFISLSDIGGQESLVFSYRPMTPFVSDNVDLDNLNCIVLPIEMRSFDASALNLTDAQVKWETSIEENVSHFELERSNDGDNWTVITEENARGNELFGAAYTYTDNNVYRLGSDKQSFYYRIKSVDNDGSFDYSEVEVVTFIGRTTNADVVLSPNPTYNTVTISVYKATDLENVDFQIANVQGQLVQEGRLSGAETMVDLELSAGIYFVRFIKEGADVFTTQKLVVSKL